MRTLGTIEFMQSKLIREGDKKSMYAKQWSVTNEGDNGSPRDQIWLQFTKKPYQIPKFCNLSMNLCHLKYKSNFLKVHIFCASVIMECQRICKNWFFQILDPNILKCTWDPKYLFFLWIWSSNGWLLLGDIHYFWNMHHEVIGLIVGTGALAEVVSGNNL